MGATPKIYISPMQTPGMDYLNSRLMFGMQPGLKNTYDLCDALGNPERSFKSIHVVGTNGKGSTAFYLAGILKAHGYKVGFYSSPHLISLQERIRVDDVPIPAADLDRLLLQVKSAAEKIQVEPTFFEVVTLAAFLYYKEQQIDVAVLEAGMGGRLDSTACARGGIAVLTSIGLEHTEVLGPTEEAILKEKMAVLCERKRATGPQAYVVGGISGKLLDAARFYAESRGIPCHVPKVREDIALPNLGRHYAENASLSMRAAQLFVARSGKTFDEALALDCLKTRSWAGRMQLLRDKEGHVHYILDGAHNSHAVRRLVETLQQYYPGQKFRCVFGALKDKDVDVMLKMMEPVVSEWHLTRTPYPRFRELDELRQLVEGCGLKVANAEPISKAFLESAVDPSIPTPVLITGSLYMIGAAIELLKNDFEELQFFRGLEPTTNEHR